MEEEKDHTIPCIGVDDKLHVCLPWENVTKCGIKVKKKLVKDKDWHTKYSCYECTY